MTPSSPNKTQQVSLSRADWIKIALSNVIAVGTIIVTLWVKQAVLENEVQHLKDAVGKLEDAITKRWR